MKDLGRLTLEERVGQLFFVGFQGLVPDAETKARFERIRPGGIVFLQRNVQSIDRTYELNLHLQSQANPPVFLAMNQEGGAVDRLKHVVAPIPSVAELADLGTAAVRAGARLIASELDACGFNLNLTPVLDLGLPGSVMRERALAAAPIEVSRLGRVVIDEFEKKALLSCGRHFPGLGGPSATPISCCLESNGPAGNSLPRMSSHSTSCRRDWTWCSYPTATIPPWVTFVPFRLPFRIA